MGSKKGMVKKSKVAAKKKNGFSKGSVAGVVKGNGAIVKAPVTQKIRVGKRVTSFARALASSQRKVRDVAFSALEAWLETHQLMSDVEMQKLWKALFYFIWMTDKEAEIDKVVNKVIALGDVAGPQYSAGMLRCLVTEWHGIDRLRIDKFYHLLTEGLKHGLEVVTAGETDEDILRGSTEFVHVIDQEVFSKADKEGKGISLHFLDKWMPIVAHTVVEALQQESKLKAVEISCEPIFNLLILNDAAVSRRSKEAFELILDEWINLGEENIDSVLIDPLPEIVLYIRDQLFNLAANQEVPDDKRESLYALWMKSKSVADVFAKEHEGAKQRLLPDPKSNASRKKKIKERKLKGKLLRAQQVEKAKKTKAKGKPSAASSGSSNENPDVELDEITPKKMKSKASKKESASENRKSASERKKVRFSLENNEVHILPKKKKSAARMGWGIS